MALLNALCEYETYQISTSKNKLAQVRAHCNLMPTGLLSGKTETVQCSYLFIWAGDKGCDIYGTWTLSESQKNKVKGYWDKFCEYIEPSVNAKVRRFTFQKQEPKT